MQLTYVLVSDRTPRTPFKMAVRLDGKVVGHVLSRARDQYFYQPKGRTAPGVTFDTLEAVQESLEATA